MSEPTRLEQEQALTIHDLRLRLDEAEEVLGAIRRGEVDALVVKPGERPQVWSVNGVEQVYRVLFETLNEGALTLGPDGTILYSNTQFAGLLGRRLQRVLGTSFEEHVAAEDVEVFHMLLRRGLRRSSKGELTLVASGGRRVPVQISLNAVEIETVGTTATMVVSDLTELKRVQASLAEANDHLEERVRERTAELEAEITYRKRLEEALEERNAALTQANQRKNEFLAMLGHELRNPLAPITNAMEMLRLRAGDNPNIDRAHNVIDRQIKHMARLVDDLLDVSRITRGVVELRRERVDLCTAVESAVTACRAQFEAVRHEVKLSLPAKACHVDGDGTRLEQVVVNLVSNATKYTPPGGKIWVTLERHGDWAELTVRDTGRGIPPEMLPQIFDLFTQVDVSVDRSLGGLGIGLTLVKNLVELHGGSVHASSDGPGAGTEVLVRLPLLPARKAVPADQRSVPDGNGRKLKVLVVEDNVDSAETLAELIQMWGHQVQVIHHGQAAIETAASLQPHVVLLDIGLPGLDGYQVAQQIRRQPALDGTTLVALTGYGQEEDRRRAFSAGFDHHLTKPISPDHLQSLLVTVKPYAVDSISHVPTEPHHADGTARVAPEPHHADEGEHPLLH